MLPLQNAKPKHAHSLEDGTAECQTRLCKNCLLVHLNKLRSGCLLKPLSQSLLGELPTVGCALVIIVLEQQHRGHFGDALHQRCLSHMAKLKVCAQSLGSGQESFEVFGGVAVKDTHNANVLLVEVCDASLGCDV